MNLLASEGRAQPGGWTAAFNSRRYFSFLFPLISMIASGVAEAIAPAGVSLAWDPVAGDVAGYRLYIGQQSGQYSQVVDAGNATQATLTNLSYGSTYFFSVTAYSTEGIESDYASEITYQVGSQTNPPPAVTMTAPTDGSVFPEPANIQLAATVATNGHDISRVLFYSGATFLGQSVSPPYTFDWTNVPAGNYPLTAQVWYDGAVAASSPVANVTVNSGRPPPTGPTLAITQVSGGIPTIQGTGSASHVYDVQTTSDFATWTSLGTVTADAGGNFGFSDPGAPSVSIRFYRVQDLSVAGYYELTAAARAILPR
jgi:hypothetical protein